MALRRPRQQSPRTTRREVSLLFRSGAAFEVPPSPARRVPIARLPHRKASPLATLATVFALMSLLALPLMLDMSADAAATSLTTNVTASSDDARSTDQNGFSATEPSALVGAGNQRPNVNGYRFANLAIPRGAIIDAASFSLVKQGDQWQQFQVSFGFEASDDAATFSSASAPAARPRTTAQVALSDNIQRTGGVRYTLGNKAALASALQEVVNRPGWQSGNAVALIAHGAPTTGWSRLGFATFDAGAAQAPRLEVTYHLAAPAGTPTRTLPPTLKPTQMPTTPPTLAATARPSAKPSPSAAPSTSPSAAPSAATTPAPSAATIPAPTATASGTPVPVAGQPCPAWVHDRYRAPGPDGKLYATWHPPTDPQYGCFFGHEHGDDPNGAPALRGRTIIFDYVNGLAGRSEAHVGFKIFRWDNVQHPNAPSHSGAQLVMMIHQGSATDNAFTEPFHEIAVHYYNPADGREIHAYMLAPFGKLAIGCGANDPQMFTIQQANVPGMRQIPGAQCYGAALKDAPGTVPGSIPYEDWITALYIGVDGQGNAKAYFDPHFAIFNPNRYCILQNGTCTLGRSDVRAGNGRDPFSAQSPYKGTKREAYLNQAHLANAGGSTAVWTDVHGKLVAPNSPGAIQQYVAAINARPLVNSSAFDQDAPNDDGTVRAPN